MRERVVFATFFSIVALSRGSETNLFLNAAPKFLGAASCASSGCHGGGGTNQNQSLVWSLKDFHAHRPFATLTTARSKQIAAALQIKDPTSDSRCTTCHAPLAAVPEANRGPSFHVSEGVSCESCHGPAENWLRGHTRTNWTTADRTAAGMRDLKNLYVRANTCIACHQTVETPLLRAGHPELTFELDGQSVAEPRHWRESSNWSGPQAWFVGQAAALRELSWQVSRESVPDQKLVARWSALLWLLQQLDGLNSDLPKLSAPALSPDPQNATALLNTADTLARRAAETPWTPQMSVTTLQALAPTAASFKQTQIPGLQQALRAERLVLALDRLVTGQKQFASANAKLNELFQDVQSRDDFDSGVFAKHLGEFAEIIRSRDVPPASTNANLGSPSPR